MKACYFIIKRLQHRWFLRILRNFLEQLFWRTSAKAASVVIKLNKANTMLSKLRHRGWKYSEFSLVCFTCLSLKYRISQKTSVITGRNSHLRCSIKKLFLKILQNSQESTCAESQSLRPATLLKKETLAQVFSWEFCENFKSTLFTDHLQKTASVYYRKISQDNVLLGLEIPTQVLHLKTPNS